jgi:sugar-specific transcriptional regulator TrmB
MLSDGDAEQLLTRLGLTPLEARIYLSLCKYGRLTAKALNCLTKIAQPDIYRVATQLQKQGMIEKVIEKPVRFGAIPIEKGVAFLLERRKADQNDLKLKSELLLREFKERPSEAIEIETAHFVMIPQKEIIVNKIREAIEKSTRNIDMYLSWKRFFTGVKDTFAECSENAWAIGVRFRVVVEKPETAADIELANQFSRRSPFCNVRFLQGSPKTVFGIYDKKEVFIIVNPKSGLLDSPALWSNNQSLISAMRDYFEVLWHNATGKPKL